MNTSEKATHVIDCWPSLPEEHGSGKPFPCMLVDELRKFLSELNVMKVLEAIEETCNICWTHPAMDNSRACYYCYKNIDD